MLLQGAGEVSDAGHTSVVLQSQLQQALAERLRRQESGACIDCDTLLLRPELKLLLRMLVSSHAGDDGEISEAGDH